MKSAGEADLLKGVCFFAQQSAGGLKPVLNQRLNGGAAQVGMKAAPGFAAADMGGIGNILQGDGLRIMLVDVSEHLLEADLTFQLDLCGLGFWEMLKIAKDVLQYAAEVALYRQFIALPLFTEIAVGVLDHGVNFASLPEYDKGQGIAPGNGLNICLINRALFGSDGSAGKEDNGDRIGAVTGQLSDSVQHISVDKDAVARLQRDVLLPDLVIQNTTFGGGKFKVRVPMEGPRPIRQFTQLIVIVADRKFCGFVRDLFPQLMVKYDRHD